MVDKKLDSYVSNYTQFNDWLIRRRYQYLTQFFKGRTCLEMGSADGSGTPYLIEQFDKVVSVDGSMDAVKRLRNKIKDDKLTVIHSYFEDLNLDGERYDTIILAHILEHVDDPVNILKIARSLLSKNGIIIVDVPNGNSLHRQVGVEMGLLKQRTELNQADLSIGHQRVYEPITFKRDIDNAGLSLVKFGGMFVKVVSNSQTEEIFDKKQLEALFKIGENNPNIAAEIFAICKK